MGERELVAWSTRDGREVGPGRSVGWGTTNARCVRRDLARTVERGSHCKRFLQMRKREFFQCMHRGRRRVAECHAKHRLRIEFRHVVRFDAHGARYACASSARHRDEANVCDDVRDDGRRRDRTGTILITRQPIDTDWSDRHMVGNARALSAKCARSRTTRTCTQRRLVFA